MQKPRDAAYYSTVKGPASPAAKKPTERGFARSSPPWLGHEVIFLCISYQHISQNKRWEMLCNKFEPKHLDFVFKSHRIYSLPYLSTSLSISKSNQCNLIHQQLKENQVIILIDAFDV